MASLYELDNPLTDDQKLALLEIAGNIKCGHLKMMSVEFDAVENDLCTECMSGDDHDDPDLCLTKENTYKRKCNIFDTGDLKTLNRIARLSSCTLNSKCQFL